MTDCGQFSEDYELYALGLLEGPEKVAFDEHLAAGCENCASQINAALELNALISSQAPQAAPSALLRQRISQTFAPAPAVRRVAKRWMFALAVAAVVVVALAAGWSYEHAARLRENAVAQTNSAELARLGNAFRILQAPGVKQVTFGPQPAAPHGSLFIQDRVGILLIAAGLPAPPPGWRYESWIVPKNGAPKPIEPFQADPDGPAMSLIPGPLTLADIKAIAVSVEPPNVPATTPTKVILAAPLGD